MSSSKLADYLSKVAESDPKTALEIAIAESSRVAAEAERAAQEYRAVLSDAGDARRRQGCRAREAYGRRKARDD